MEAVAYFSLFIIGLSYGSTACMFSCMPFLSPILINNANNFRQSINIVLPFSLGRIFTYTLIAIAAVSGAGFVKAVLNDGKVFQLLLGVLTIAMGLFMFYRVWKKNAKSCSHNSSIIKSTTTSTLGLFGIGVLVSINPCTPILTLIALSANSGSVPNAIGMGISFGLGAVLVPFLFYGFFLSNVIRGLLVEFKSYGKIIEVSASVLLIVVGVLILNGHIKL